MLRCRRCRRGVMDSACLATDDATDESSCALCRIWHVSVDELPEWILTSVHQAQWTVGKINCQNCRARLGGFNFLSRTKCPCGQDTTVHLNKSRVDRDHKHRVLIAQPRRTRLDKDPAAPPTDNTEDNVGTLRISCAAAAAAAAAHIGATEASSSLRDNQSFPFSPLYCLSHRRRCSVEDAAAFTSSCFCPGSLVDGSAAGSTWAGTDDESPRSPVSCPTRRELDADGEASGSLAGRRLLPDQPPRQTVATTSVHEDESHSTRFLRGRTAPGRDEPRASSTSPASNSRSRRERNRLKGLRRKQRRRERWLLRRLEQVQSASGSLGDSEGDEEDRDGLTCAVCLDVYFSPYSCRPCAHVFCEPCLRTLAKNRPANTPCPLCRTLISHTDFHQELDQSVQTFFPKVYYGRQLNFKKAPCTKWPLPCGRKCFRTFWGFQRHAAAMRRRWRLSHGAFTLDTLNFSRARGRLFGGGGGSRSVSWVLAFLLLCFLAFYFFC